MTDSWLHSSDTASLRWPLSASEAGPTPLTKSWIRTWGAREISVLLPAKSYKLDRMVHAPCLDNNSCLVSTYVVRCKGFQSFAQNSLSAPTQVFQECWYEHPTLPPSSPRKMKSWADLGIWDLSWSGVGAGVWRLIAVSPKDTVSFHILSQFSSHMVVCLVCAGTAIFNIDMVCSGGWVRSVIDAIRNAA